MSLSADLRLAAAELQALAEQPGRWFAPDRIDYIATLIEASAMRAEALEETAFATALRNRRAFAPAGNVVAGPWGRR